MKTKQGISLIVLVITIIVMTILAGAVVLTLNNSGIINNASEAVEQTNLATVKELAQVAWASAYASGERTTEKLKEAVDKELEAHKVDTTTKYAVEVTEAGVDVILRGSWVQKGLKVTDGKITLEVGDVVNYVATDTDYTDKWKVLGASKYGELLIMSDEDVDKMVLGKNNDLETTKNDWLNVVSKLDNACRPYGKGAGAVNARSIRSQDIERITGFDKTKEENYGFEAWYSAAGEGKIEVYAPDTVGEEIIDCDTFYYIDGTTLKQADFKNGFSIGVTNTWYSYNIDKSDISSKAENMLFKMTRYDDGKDEYIYDEPANYWLATTFVETSLEGIFYGAHCVSEGDISTWLQLNSFGEVYRENSGVRAVVTLSPTIQLIGSSETGWSY